MDAKTLEVIENSKIQVNDQGGNLRKFDMAELFEIDETNLTKEFSRQAALYAYFAVIAAKADMEVAQLDFAVEQEYAKADEVFRAELTAAGTKFTEAVVKSMIMTDEEYTKLVEGHIGAKYDLKIIKAITAALEMRANMLISMGAFIRHEIDQTNMNIQRRAMENTVTDVKEVIKSRKK